jgi:hypothetical protein
VFAMVGVVVIALAPAKQSVEKTSAVVAAWGWELENRHKPDHQFVRGLASEFRHSHACGSQVRKVPPNPSQRVSSVGRLHHRAHLQQPAGVGEERSAAGGCELRTPGKWYQPSAQKVVRDPTRRRFPIPVRLVLRTVGANEYMELSASRPTHGVAP